MTFIAADRQWHASSAAGADLCWDARLLGHLGRDLRAIYEETVQEPLPERLTALLHSLEERVAARHRRRGPGHALP